MSIPGSASPLLLASTAAAAGGYQVSRSLRFNSPDTAFLNRTPSVASNRRTWTWSGWIKRGRTTSLGEMFFAAQPLYICFTGSNATGTSPDRIALSNIAVNSVNIETAAVFRDFSAWFHLVVALDTTQTTSSDRVKIYVNGQLAALSYAVYPSLSEEMSINSTLPHGIGRSFVGAGNDWDIFSGYLADIHFIDGQALTPSSFTEVSATTGQLIPKTYTGTYGTNGFQLKFADNSSNTATTLGKDTSGNSNNWTPNNLSVTAGAGNDSLVDTPTSISATDTGVGGEIRGNYCTLNPLDNGGVDLSNGNLDVSNGAAHEAVRTTIKLPSTGKWYAEATWISNISGGDIFAFGIDFGTSATPSHWQTSGHFFIGLNSSGFTVFNLNGSDVSSTGSSASVGMTLQVAYDADNSRVWLGRNNTWFDGSYGTTGSPSTGANPTRTSITGFISINVYSNTGSFNAGQRAFAYTAPSGFKALCDTNLGAPLVAKPNTLMDVVLYTGTGSTQSISSLNFSPDFLWFKSRSSANDHVLFDAVRGRAAGMRSNGTDAEYTSSAGNDLASFDSAGFTVGAPQNWSSPNGNGLSVVSWAWDAGTSTVSNTSGSITSQVRANASAGFSVVSFTTQSSSTATVGHGLNVAPTFIIQKIRTLSADWYCYHTSIGAGNIIQLNTTAASSANSTIWNNTAPTSTVWTLGNGWTGSYSTIAYCFAPVVGYSSFGSYTGNGSTDGTFVYTGFRPRFIFYKPSNIANTDWVMWDTARNPYNICSNYLLANTSGAEGSAGVIDLLSNGFKLRVTSTGNNGSGDVIIYAAFAENPFQYARAR